jgi:hypothetical protein
MLGRFLTRLAFAIVSIMIAMVAMIGAVVFLFYAAFLEFETYVSPPLAALLTTLVLVLFALVALLIGRGLSSGYRRSRRGETDTAHAFTSFFGTELGAMANRNPYLTIGGALALGLAFGLSPRFRKIAHELLRR